VLDNESRARLHGIPNRHYDALDYEVMLQINPHTGQLLGQSKMTFEVTQAVEHLVLDAETSVLAVQTSFPISSWDIDDGELTLYMSTPLKQGRKGWVAVKYSIEPGRGFYANFADDIPAKHVFTQGECNDARYWIPCNDQPSDRATYSVSAIIPPHWESVSGGDLIEERLIDRNRKLVKWQMLDEVPPYLFSFVAGEFVKITSPHASRSLDSSEIYFVVEAGDADQAQVALSRTADAIDFMEAYTQVKYPFSKYSQAAVRGFPYGAMENASATTMNRSLIIADQTQRPAWPTVVHELAHQWFGDIVTCEEWPHAWLNEGFATYFTALYREARFGQDDFLYHYGQTLDGYLNACRGPKLRALVKHSYKEPMDLFFDGTIYPGGASRLHLLRGWYGEKTFKAAITRYLNDNYFSAVNSDDLKRAFSDVDCEGLESFFRQWVYSVGYPELKLEWSQSRGELKIDVTQVQVAQNPKSDPDSLSRSSVWAFKFPLDIRYKLVGGQIKQQRVWVSRRQQSFSLAEQQAVDWLSFDPEAFIPARIEVLEPLEKTMARLLDSNSVRDQVLAVRKLSEQAHGQLDLQKLLEIAEDDKRYEMLRVEVLRLIRKQDRNWLFKHSRANPPSEAWLESLPAAVAREWRAAIVHS